MGLFSKPTRVVEEIRVIGDMQRLTIRPGDMFVLSCPGPISAEFAKHIRRQIEENMPGQKFLILGDGMKLGVVNVEELRCGSDASAKLVRVATEATAE